MSSTNNNKSTSFFPLAGVANDGYSTETRATATCLCGAVQVEFPTEGEGLVDSFICHCWDCRKITASMFASNFITTDATTRFTRGADKLTVYSQAATIASHNTMANHFCSLCGTLMYRVGAGFPGVKIMRIGTVDDFALHEGKLKPRVEQFARNRVEWLGKEGAEGVRQEEGNFYDSSKM